MIYYNSIKAFVIHKKRGGGEMGLSPEERRKIYEEEKARIEAREKIKAEEKEEAKGEKVKWSPVTYVFLTIGVLFIVFFIVIAIVSSPEQKTFDLNADVYFNGTQLIIKNHENFDLTNITMMINEKYTLKVSRIKAGTNYMVGVMQFTDQNGTRFNPFITKAVDFSLFCDTPKGRGYVGGKLP